MKGIETSKKPRSNLKPFLVIKVVAYLRPSFSKWVPNLVVQTKVIHNIPQVERLYRSSCLRRST